MDKRTSIDMHSFLKSFFVHVIVSIPVHTYCRLFFLLDISQCASKILAVQFVSIQDKQFLCFILIIIFLGANRFFGPCILSKYLSTK